MQVGDTVALKKRKARSVVVRFLDKKNAQNNWNGWVEVSPHLYGFSRYPKDELEVIRSNNV